jgi:carbamate kinase
MIGYLLEQGLASVMPERRTATLLTQVIVDADDPAFGAPSKPVGPIYSRPEAARLAAERGWAVAPDGESWRRVVPSPEPRRIVELEAIRTLVDAGMIVVCVGGGGVPVIADEHGALHGVEAVIDKDLSAALLARELGADVLLLLTDVPSIELDRGQPTARPLVSATPSQLAELRLPAGSMGPKAEAAGRFVRETGGTAAIGAPGDAAAILAGRAGTTVFPECTALRGAQHAGASA